MTKMQVAVDQAQHKNKELTKEIGRLLLIIDQKDAEIQKLNDSVETSKQYYESRIEEMNLEIDKQSGLIESYRQNVEFLEQAHLTKANFYESKEKALISTIEELKIERDTILEREYEQITKERKSCQKWKHRAKQFKDTISIVKANGESEWLTIYNEMMEKINSLNRDVERLKVENEILTKRSKSSISSPVKLHEKDKENISINHLKYHLESSNPAFKYTLN